METESKIHRINRVENKIRGDNLVFFREWMIKEVHSWKDFNYQDWLLILDKIKNDTMKLYSFFPFAYRILGIKILHEFESLEGVDESSIKYVDKGKGFHIHSLRINDLAFYQKNKVVMDQVLEVRKKLVTQGAIPTKEYTLSAGKQIGNYNQYKIFRRKITREEITKVSIEEIFQEKYLHEVRDLTQYKNEK